MRRAGIERGQGPEARAAHDVQDSCVLKEVAVPGHDHLVSAAEPDQVEETRRRGCPRRDAPGEFVVTVEKMSGRRLTWLRRRARVFFGAGRRACRVDVCRPASAACGRFTLVALNPFVVCFVSLLLNGRNIDLFGLVILDAEKFNDAADDTGG